MEASGGFSTAGSAPRLKRTLTLWNLIFIGVIMIQPVAPMGIFGVINNKAGGHVATAILLAMAAMLLTAISYGRMARVHPSAGSAYTFVGKELHPGLGFVTGWSMLMDYMLNPLICIALSAKLTMNLLPVMNFACWCVFYALLFTALNLRGVKTSAKLNEILCLAMFVVVAIFFAAVIRAVWGMQDLTPGFFTQPLFNPATFNFSHVIAGASVATLTYIGFDSISTFSEEVENPRRNILLATVGVCVIIGLLSTLEVYAAQLIWGPGSFPEEQVESAFVLVAKKAGGLFLYNLIDITLLVATIGSGMAAQLAAGRLLYGMGRGNALPSKFFGAIEPKRQIPRNNIVLTGCFALCGALALEHFSALLGGGAFEIGAQALNFGAFIGFMGVNAASLTHYWWRAEKGSRSLSDLLPPLAGIAICFYIWLMLSGTAKIVGVVWMLSGIIYGALRTHGFKGGLISFESPEDKS